MSSLWPFAGCNLGNWFADSSSPEQILDAGGVTCLSPVIGNRFCPMGKLSSPSLHFGNIWKLSTAEGICRTYSRAASCFGISDRDFGSGCFCWLTCTRSARLQRNSLHQANHSLTVLKNGSQIHSKRNKILFIDLQTSNSNRILNETPYSFLRAMTALSHSCQSGKDIL